MFRDDMISDGIENCVQYIHNFDPNKSKNPFAYFTQIIHYAFLRRIQKEKKQLEIKTKIIEKSGFDEVMTVDDGINLIFFEIWKEDIIIKLLEIVIDISSTFSGTEMLVCNNYDVHLLEDLY